MISVPVRIVDPNKDLNSYGLNSVDWKERVESWRVKQDKSMMQVANNKYPDARGGGDMEGTGSNGEDMQMYAQPFSVTILDSFICSMLQFVVYSKFCFHDIDASVLLFLAGLMMHVYL
jgi:hypothetical protein